MFCFRHGELKPEDIGKRGKRKRCRLCANLEGQKYRDTHRERCNYNSNINYHKHKHIRKLRLTGLAPTKSKLVELECAFCNKKFKRPEHYINKERRRGTAKLFCSMACVYDNKRKLKTVAHTKIISYPIRNSHLRKRIL